MSNLRRAGPVSDLLLGMCLNADVEALLALLAIPEDQ